LRLDSFERLPASAQTAIGALDLGARKHGADSGEPAGAIGVDDILRERACRPLLGASRLPQRRERVELSYGTSRKRAGGGHREHDDDNNSTRDHARTINRKIGGELGQPLGSQPGELTELDAAEFREIGRGLDIAREYGVADLDDDDDWVAGDLSRLERE
jgi:hypothetical protein